MIYAPVLWVALLVTAPPPSSLECDELALDPIVVYVAHGDLVMPAEARVWQCTTVTEPPPKKKKRYRRRR